MLFAAWNTQIFRYSTVHPIDWNIFLRYFTEVHEIVDCPSTVDHVTSGTSLCLLFSIRSARENDARQYVNPFET
jgi:hypothetical protein